MRKFTFVFPLFLALIAILSASCGSNRSFSSRKYTAGNYVSHKHKPGKATVQEHAQPEAAVAAKDEVPPGKADLAGKADLSSKEEVATFVHTGTDKTALGMSSSATRKAAPAQGMEEKTDAAQKAFEAKALKREAFRKYIADNTERKCLAYDDGDGNSLDSVALVSFILGIVGLVLNILAISVIVATSEYVFALLFIAGLVMGIIAVVFGTQGLRRYHKNKNGTINLVFSIIGTAFGAGAIITAFVFAFYTLILALSGL